MFQMADDGHYWILGWNCWFPPPSNYRHYLRVQVGAHQLLHSGATTTTTHFHVKYNIHPLFLQKGDFPGAFTFTVGYSVIFVVASCTLVLYQPAAAGSGIPEIIGFLNGTKIKDIFKLQTLIVKFLSCAFAVGAGMPVGYEGPMIHLGSLAAAGISQFKSGMFIYDYVMSIYVDILYLLY